ncbi:hypothetical protein GCM10022419_061860 [Nonomuraea rosea]|uniref:Uncharacterized protein n=1 Tax=Nonomuraea rosea TaxID=638574 RepID=A0ABP6XTX1_9ACTN
MSQEEDDEQYERAQESYVFLRGLMHLAQNPLFHASELTWAQKVQLVEAMAGIIGVSDRMSSASLLSIPEVLELLQEEGEPQIDPNDYSQQQLTSKSVQLGLVAERVWPLYSQLERVLRKLSGDIPLSDPGLRRESVTMSIEPWPPQASDTSSSFPSNSSQ